MCCILPGLPPQRDLSPHCWFIRTSESVEGTRMEPGGWQYRAMIYRLDYHHGNGNPNHINQTFVGSRRLCVYKTYIWLYLTQFTSQVIILSSLYKKKDYWFHDAHKLYMRRGRQLLLALLTLWFVCEAWSRYWWFSHSNYPGRTNTFISRSLTQGMSCTC